MHQQKLTIGLPVYNGEKYLRSRLKSILSQSFNDFELIISDNASDDKTHNICQEFIKMDSRIKYIRQSKNIGIINNFNFILELASKKYFIWAAIDDIWEPEFLKKNIDFLELHNNFVASISKVSRFGGDIEKFNENITDDRFIKFYKKIRRRFRNFGVWSTQGNFNQRVRIYLRSSSAQAIYSVFRQEPLKKSIVKDKISGWDMAVILNVLRYGDINVLNDTLIHFSWEGLSRKGAKDIQGKLIFQYGRLSYFFPQLDFAKWCWNNLGKKIFISNLDYFLFVNLWSFIISIKEFLKN